VVETASVRGERSVPLTEFLTGPKRNALADDELILGVRVRGLGRPETFLKVGPRNAMVISVVSLALTVDRERDELRAAFGSAGPVPGLVTAPLGAVDGFAELVADAASPIDDVRGTADYRRHALRVLTARAVERCLA
jgi:CO/xanthine dehydrogenase FAD-binding subunit